MTIINHQLVFSVNETIPIFFMACFDSISSSEVFKKIPDTGNEEEHFCICSLFRVRNGNAEDRILLGKKYIASRLDLHYCLALVLDLPQYHHVEKHLLIQPPQRKLSEGH